MENFLDQFYELTKEIQSMSTCITEADTISPFTGKFHISNLDKFSVNEFEEVVILISYLIG